MPIYQFAIHSGYNVPLGSLVNIERIIPSLGRVFYPPVVDPGEDTGQEAFRGDGNVFDRGFAMIPWKFKLLTRYQWYYFYSTINGNSRTGPVTIYTTGLPGSSYARLNAILYLPKPSTTTKNFSQLIDYTVEMQRIAPPS